MPFARQIAMRPDPPEGHPLQRFLTGAMRVGKRCGFALRRA